MSRAALVPAEAGDHAVGGARVLDLEHRALARLVRRVGRFGDDAVEPGAFEALQPVTRGRGVAGQRRQENRGSDVVQERRERFAAPACCGRSIRLVPSAARRSNATNEAGASAASLATRDAAGCRRSCSVSKSRPPSLAMTISPSRTHPSGRRRQKWIVQVGEVAIERLEIAALDVDLARAAAEHHRPEAIPFRFVQPRVAFRDCIGNFREHRLDRRRNRKRGHAPTRIVGWRRDRIRL